MTADKRRRKSKVHRAPWRERFEQLLREDSHTLDSMVAIIKAEFPDAEEPTRSGLYRYEQQFRSLTERMREIDQAANALVGEFGDSLGEKASTLLANSVVTLVTDLALKKQGEAEVDVETVRKLARAAKDAIDTKRVDVNVRKAIAAEAREALLREQTKKLDKVSKTGKYDPATLERIRSEVYGLQ